MRKKMRKMRKNADRIPPPPSASIATWRHMPCSWRRGSRACMPLTHTHTRERCTSCSLCGPLPSGRWDARVSVKGLAGATAPCQARHPHWRPPLLLYSSTRPFEHRYLHCAVHAKREGMPGATGQGGKKIALRGGGGDTEAHFPNPPPSLAAVTGGEVQGRGGGVIGGKKLFRAKFCVPAPSAPTSVLTQNKGPDTEPHFSNPPPLLRRASMSPPPRRAIFRSPNYWCSVLRGVVPQSLPVGRSCRGVLLRVQDPELGEDVETAKGQRFLPARQVRQCTYKQACVSSRGYLGQTGS